MNHVLTSEEAQEARRLIARLGELLKAAEEAPASIPTPAATGARVLSDADFDYAASRLRCDVAAICAVWEVESAGEGHGSDGRATVLYEGHKFSALTGGKYDSAYGGVSWPKWDRKRYPRGTADERHKANWDKILFAARLDKDAAYKSASYGAAQIMGFNHASAGYPDVHAFVTAMNESASKQLDAFVSLILDWKLDDELREHRWADFARRYNGPGYAANAYDTKLAAAHRKWSQA